MTTRSQTSAFPAFPLRRHRAAAFSLTEVVVAGAVLVLLAVALIGSLLHANRYAAAARVLTNARVIVQRNIDTALGVKFTAVEIPAILAVTEEEGEVFGDYDLEGVLNTGDDPVPIQMTGSDDVLISGTLTRIVLPYEIATNGAVIRRVTFRLDYRFQDRPFSYSMTTLRAQDEQ